MQTEYKVGDHVVYLGGETLEIIEVRECSCGSGHTQYLLTGEIVADDSEIKAN